MVAEDTSKDSKGKKQLIVLPSYDYYKQWQWPACHNHPKSTVVACIPW